MADLDDAGTTVTVQRSLQRRPDGRLVLTPTKTKASDRVLPLPGVLAAELARRRSAQSDERAAAGVEWRDNDLILATQLGGPINPRNDYRSLQAIGRRAGLRRVRLHDLRHTTASLLLEAGIPPRVVMEILGHSQISVAMDTYTHVDTALSRNALERLQHLLGGEPQ